MKRDWAPLGCITALALGLRLLYLLEIRSLPDFAMPDPILDAALFDRIARNIVSGQWLGGPEARYATSHFYAYFLALWYALFGQSWLLPRLVQLTLGGLAPLLLYLIGRRAFGRPVGLLAAFMGAIYGPFIFGEGLVLHSGLTPILVCLALLRLLVAQQRGFRRDWLLAGAAIGLLILMRPNAGILLPVACGWAILVGERANLWSRAQRGLLLLLGAFAVCIPLAVRDLTADPSPASVASLSGIHFYIGNHRGADGRYSRVPGIEGSPRGHVEDAARLAERALGRPLTAAEVSAYWFRKGLQFIREEPGEYLSLLGRKLLLALNSEEPSHNENNYSRTRRQVAVLRLPLLTFTVIGPLGLLGLLLSLNRWRGSGLLHLSFLAYLGSLLLFFVTGVYRVPLVPPLLVFAAFTIWWGYERATEGAGLPLGVAAVALVMLVRLVQAQVVPPESESLTKEERAEREELAQRWREARVHQVEEAVAVVPGNYQFHLELAGLYSEQQRWEKAVEEFERAAALAPEEEAGDIRVRLAKSLTEAKRYTEAKRRWEEVLAMDPPPGIAELARRRLLRIEQLLRSERPSAAREQGAR